MIKRPARIEAEGKAMKSGMMGSGLHRAARRTVPFFGVLLVALAAASMAGTKAAYASTFTVNSTGDEGDQATNLWHRREH